MDTKQRQMKWRVCRSICRYELVFSFPSHCDELDVLLVTGSFAPLGNNPLSFLRLLQLASGKDRIKTIFEKLYVLKLRYSSQPTLSTTESTFLSKEMISSYLNSLKNLISSFVNGIPDTSLQTLDSRYWNFDITRHKSQMQNLNVNHRKSTSSLHTCIHVNTITLS